MSDTVENKWDKIYSKKTDPITPCELLASLDHLLPATGKALDLACGRGGNALHMAAKGLAVDAVDISSVGLECLSQTAQAKGLDDRVKSLQHDIIADPSLLVPEKYNVIVVSMFLHRPLSDALVTALKPEGLLFYQTFHRDKLSSQGPSSDDFLLKPNELLSMFSPLRVVHYQEWVTEGDIKVGDRNCAWLVAKK